MAKNIKQVTDNIHETIYLSQLESELISTPYFYRLHDIYQSSTVYMTFPANRTKRYEHSLGTMEIASSMFYAAVSNADSETKKEMFLQLQDKFYDLLGLILKSKKEIDAPYLKKHIDDISELFKRVLGNSGNNGYVNENEILFDSFSKIIMDAVAEGALDDSAIDHFQFYPAALDSGTSNKGRITFFLYRCLLQAIRIIALFHDVGHPPYSHIIEEVLNLLYDECQQAKNDGKENDKTKIFLEVMDPYISDTGDKSKFIYSEGFKSDAALHERVGLSLLQSAIYDVITDIFGIILISSDDDDSKFTKIIYYITSIEFAGAMLTDKDLFFSSFHRLTDGVLDADRFDYIMRDSLNSGVDWGCVPYKRILNSAQLVYFKGLSGESIPKDKRPFVVCYPQKLMDDISDLLLIRYKIFARINFHHKCMRTAAELQSVVLSLSRDYLFSDSGVYICEDIKFLWLALEAGTGERMNRIIQWNDSWLITVLHSALNELTLDRGSLDEDKKFLAQDLDALLLNKNRYYPVFRHSSDCREFVKLVFDAAGITNEKIDKFLSDELKKLLSESDYPANPYSSVDFFNSPGTKDVRQLTLSSTVDSVKRITLLRRIMDSGDLDQLDQLFPLDDNGIDEKAEEILKLLKEEEKILDYKFILNKGRGKTGLPSHKSPLDDIYLLDRQNCPYRFDSQNSLDVEINTLMGGVPWFYMYFVPPDSASVDDLSNEILKDIANAVGESLGKRMDMEFSGND